MNYEIGDKVQVLSWEQLIKNSLGGVDNEGDLKIGPFYFVQGMRWSCDHVGTIIKIDKHRGEIFYKLKFDEETDRDFSYIGQMVTKYIPAELLPKRENGFDEKLL